MILSKTCQILNDNFFKIIHILHHASLGHGTIAVRYINP